MKYLSRYNPVPEADSIDEFVEPVKKDDRICIID